ncbi:hypothetical protein LEMLEM_LOCUS19637 [Lemmus lemmus]
MSGCLPHSSSCQAALDPLCTASPHACRQPRPELELGGHCTLVSDPYMRHVCSWKHQSTSRGRCTSKRLLIEFDSRLGKKLLLPGLRDLTCSTHRKMTTEVA